MSRTLVISSAAGLLLCAVFLGLAVRIGGDDIFHDSRSLQQLKPLIDVATHKAWRWNGGDTLAMDAPINIRYEAKGSPQVSVTGPAELVQHVRVSDGRIGADTSVTRASGRKLEAVVSGMPIRKFVVNGGENLDLGDIDQPGLDLYLNGSGTVNGRGKVDRLNLTIAGPGKANLGGLSVAGDARISILGSGEASLSPHGAVRLFIAGSGNLQLLTRPEELRETQVGAEEANPVGGEKPRKKKRSRRWMSEIVSGRQETPYAQAWATARSEGCRGSHTQWHRQRRHRPACAGLVARGLSQTTIAQYRRRGVHGYKDVDLGHVERRIP
jgi:hypothetical protein